MLFLFKSNISVPCILLLSFAQDVLNFSAFFPMRSERQQDQLSFGRCPVIVELVPRIVVCEDKESVTFSISGDINAEFVWPPLSESSASSKTIRINLSRVHYINSVGVKNWIRSFPFVGRKVELFEVNVHVMDAFNMTPAMQMGCRIMSFFVPVFCDKCEEKFELVSVKEIDFQSEEKIRIKPCTCGCQPVIDVDLDMYFTCLGAQFRAAS